MINVIPKRRILPRGFSTDYCRGCGAELDVFKTMDVLKLPADLKPEKGVGYVIRLPRQPPPEDFSVLFQNLLRTSGEGVQATKPTSYAEAVNMRASSGMPTPRAP